MDDPIEEVAGLRESGPRAALASLVWSSDCISVSQRAKVLVRENGGLSGTIGGRSLEAELLALGRLEVAV